MGKLIWMKCIMCGNIKTLHEDVPKRHPDINGVLPLTENELEELSEFLYGGKKTSCVMLNGHGILNSITNNENEEVWIIMDEVKAILWLAERFDLSEGCICQQG